MLLKQPPTAIDLKQTNRNNIFRLVWQRKRVSRQHIMKELNLSLPTVTQNLNRLTDEGLVMENGSFGHTGGRSAVGFSIVPHARFAVGVDINKSHIAVVVIDLYGDVLVSLHDHCPFENTPAYFERAALHVEESLEKGKVPREKLLGVGISIQGLVSQDHSRVTYGPILGNTGARIEEIAKGIPYPCLLFHDADSAAFAELWVSRAKHAVYVSLSTDLGGSLIIDGANYSGDNFMAGKLEHMTLVPNGETCYCGQKGCAEMYCSSSILSGLAPDGRLETFFSMLHNKDRAAVAHWNDYLDHLSVLLNSLHMLLDIDVILGGYMAAHLEPYLPELKERSYRRNSVDTAQDYIKLAQVRNEPIATGSALYYLDSFIKSV
jgi:predicted NBD/HSP70 family sugar kinase